MQMFARIRTTIITIAAVSLAACGGTRCRMIRLRHDLLLARQRRGMIAQAPVVALYPVGRSLQHDPMHGKHAPRGWYHTSS